MHKLKPKQFVIGALFGLMLVVLVMFMVHDVDAVDSEGAGPTI